MVQPTSQDANFSDYGAVLRRRWPAVVAVALVGLLIAVGLYVASPKTYRATAAVEVTPTGVAAAAGNVGQTRSVQGSNVDLDTETQVVTSKLVARRVAHLLGVNTPPQKLSSHVSITVPPNSSVLDIQYAAHKPKAAELGANAFARAYLAERTAMAQSVLSAQINKVDHQISYLSSRLQLVNQVLKAPGGRAPGTYYWLSRRTVLQQQINQLHKQLAPLQATSITPGSLLSTATLPSSPSSPRKTYYFLGGLLGGLLVGLILAIGLEMRDHRIHSSRELRRRRGLPVLAEARLSQPAASWRPLLEQGPAGRALGELRNAVTVATGSGRRSVLVLPIEDSSSAPAVAVALTAALASTEGRATLLTTAAAFPASQSTLSDEPAATVLPLPERVAEARSLLDQLAGAADKGYVVVAAPPASSAPEGPALAGYVDTVVPVVNLQGTRLDRLDESMHALSVSGARVAGVMVVDAGELARRPFGQKPAERPAVRGGLLSRPAARGLRVAATLTGGGGAAGSDPVSSTSQAVTGKVERRADGGIASPVKSVGDDDSRRSRRWNE